MRGGLPPYRKLTLAEAFDIATVANAVGSSMQAGAARRIPVRLRESRRAALVGRGWGLGKGDGMRLGVDAELVRLGYSIISRLVVLEALGSSNIRR